MPRCVCAWELVRLERYEWRLVEASARPPYMSQTRSKRNSLGFDEPWHRDWLFLAVLFVSATGTGIGIARGTPWWVALAAFGGGVFIGGLVLGSLREIYRGYRADR